MENYKKKKKKKEKKSFGSDAYTEIGRWFQYLRLGKPGFGRTLVETPVQTPVFSPTVAPRRSQSSFNREGDTLIVTPSETISQTNQQTQQVGIELKT